MEGQKTLLLVDDEAIIAMAEKESLEKCGYRVLIAHSGREAVAAVEEDPGIDLILMDINLGRGMDGTEAAAAILGRRDIPVVFLSSHMEPEVVEKTEKITSYGYVVKDSSITVLDASIKMAFKLFAAKVGEKIKELALSQSNDLLTKLARLVPGVIYQYRLDPDGRSAFPYSSPGMSDIYEVTPEEVREDATPVFGRLHPDDYDMVAGAIQASALTLNTFYCEFRVILPRQGLRWRWSQAHPERLADGGTLWHGIILDVTERKRTEEALRISEAKQAGALQMAKAGLWEYDVERDRFTFNDNFYRIFRTTAAREGGYQMSAAEYARRFCHPDDAPQVGEETRAAIASADPEYSRQIEHRIVYADGEVGHIAVRFFIVKDAQGRTVKTYGVNQDISERKRAEDSLRENNSRLELAMQAAEMAWWEMDLATGGVTFAARKAEMLGYPPERFKHYRDFMALVHPDDYERTMDAMRGHIEGRLPRYEAEYRMTTLSGESKWFHDIGTTVQRDAGGKALKVAGLVIDISARKQAQAEIQRQLAEKEILLQEVHHRIKNNIAAIGGILSLDMKRIAHPEALAALKDAAGRVDSMRILYDKLLLSGDYQDVSVKNYMESLTQAIMSLFSDQARINLQQQFADFTLSPKRLFPLGIIINELLTNIMKYAFAGKKSGQIRISLAREGKRVTLVIEDNGVGLPRGFDLARTQGFGLTLVKMLSRQLGGEFAIESAKGTRCTVTFDV